MVKKALIFVVLTYKKLVSPLLRNSCRYHPTCSDYSMVAIEKYGPLKGLKMALLRVLRCNQFFKGGYDPVK
ncbi:MAG: membrane protein insertion efficiency factor YidD [bacterium]